MNIFFLHRNLRKCAKYHLDRHCVKMILEYTQLLCTAICVSYNGNKELESKPENKSLLKKTHVNHPCSIWVRTNIENWRWLKTLALELCSEYTYRYEKIHKLQSLIEKLEEPKLPQENFFDPPQCMPDEYKNENVIIAYREYYIKGKAHLHYWKNNKPAWKKRKIPKFIRKRIKKHD